MFLIDEKKKRQPLVQGGEEMFEWQPLSQGGAVEAGAAALAVQGAVGAVAGGLAQQAPHPLTAAPALGRRYCDR